MRGTTVDGHRRQLRPIDQTDPASITTTVKTKVWLEVDGGVTPETAPLVVKAGADVLVAGSAVFKGGTKESYGRNMSAIRDALKVPA